ncbi:MAG: F0F1 ATP synthase subunit delta [Patescibacteria group bacterium]|nr:F0F1 ATP synthase subunit delta [Patescibacteria group bacterium]
MPKYHPKIYSQALGFLLGQAKNPASQEKTIDNFLLLVKKNRDQKCLKKTLFFTEKFLLKKFGLNKFTVASARELSVGQKKAIGAAIKEEGRLDWQIEPKLIAGLKITKNYNQELNLSFSHLLGKLFN